MEYDDSGISCLSEYVREHLQQLLNAQGSIEDLPADSTADEDYFRSMPEVVREDIGDLKLNLDVSDTARIGRTERNKQRVSKMERNEANSSCKADDTVPKTRKRKGKLRGSASKSTVTTKDTYFVRRKEAKRRRYKGNIEFLHNLNFRIKTVAKFSFFFFSTNFQTGSRRYSSKIYSFEASEEIQRSGGNFS